MATIEKQIKNKVEEEDEEVEEEVGFTATRAEMNIGDEDGAKLEGASNRAQQDLLQQQLARHPCRRRRVALLESRGVSSWTLHQAATEVSLSKR